MDKSNIPFFTVFNGEFLLERKRLNDAPEDVLAFLKEKADEYLSAPQLSVTERRLKAPSGDPRDYTSFGPYWWPNPNTENHLPYVKKDGYVNPESRDENNFFLLSTKLQILSLAEFYFGSGKYAKCAEKQLYVWFIDEKLKINPHARFAQAIPGIFEGRGIGLIDFRHNIEILDSVNLLKWLGLLSEEVYLGIRKWFSEFTDWILSSEIGISADNQPNNHGSWFDAHVLALSIFLDRKNLTKRIIRTSFEMRQLKQFGPDGEQPMELRRASAVGYSLFNLSASLLIAKIAKKYGDLRYTETEILKKGAEYIARFDGRLEEFPYSKTHADEGFKRLPYCYRLLEILYPNEGYDIRAKKHLEKDMYWRLYL